MFLCQMSPWVKMCSYSRERQACRAIFGLNYLEGLRSGIFWFTTFFYGFSIDQKLLFVEIVKLEMVLQFLLSCLSKNSQMTELVPNDVW